ncbi:MAG: helix-turn-helix transcriptional regulator [Paenibacillus sp.]|jgi:DNA-binding CsgD family transcriptional regulator|nr:helix-turn-helix transcriptional regulator [Paenibacillus sp.]
MIEHPNRQDRWDQLEQHFAVGREREAEQFSLFLKDSSPTAFILNVSGTGGVGKSFLLREFRRIAQTNGSLDCWVNTHLLPHTPGPFLAVMTEFACQHLSMNNPSLMVNDNFSLQGCLDLLNKLAATRSLVLFFDEYEYARGLDGWFRNTFFRGLHSRVRIVIACRSPLDGEWASSPAWRHFISKMPLEDFSRQQVIDYLGNHGIREASQLTRAWLVTGGHPLYLSLILPLLLHRSDWLELPLSDLLSELVEQWLKETTTEVTRSLIEYLSIPRSFNQELLGYMRGNPVTDAEFVVITGLSFVKASVRGWVMHDQVREALHSLFRKNKPNEYHTAWVRCANYSYTLIVKGSKTSPDPARIGEYISCVADSMVRTILQPHTGRGSSFRLETMDNHNFTVVRKYLDRRKLHAKDKQAYYVDIQNESTYSLHMPSVQDGIRAELVNPEDWLSLGLDSIKLLRKTDGAMIGLIALIPINRVTLDYLSRQPVSRSYFQSLPASEMSALAVPGHTQAGWFLRMLDVEDAEDSAARSELMHHFLGYFQYGNLLLTSTPIRFYSKLLTSIGFREVKESIHYDYGHDIPALTYRLDLRKESFHSYLQGMAHTAGIPLSAKEHTFTEREHEIVPYIVQGLTNKEIASLLFLSEITVKKHVSSMLLKTGAKNRVQLTQMLSP